MTGKCVTCCKYIHVYTRVVYVVPVIHMYVYMSGGTKGSECNL